MILFLNSQIRKELASKVVDYKAKHPSFKPCLAVIQVGARKDSSLYVKQKQLACEEVGVKSIKHSLPEDTTSSQLKDLIMSLNDDDSVNGILLQLPLPSHIKEEVMLNLIDPEKDVDGFHEQNLGALFKKSGTPKFIPCTPKGIMVLLSKINVNPTGLQAVVLGRSDIVGTPVAALLTQANATVTVCHSRTKNIEQVVKQADILVIAIGIPCFVKGSWVKPGAVIIDVGINAIDDPTKKSGHRFVGDADYNECKKVASYITPVPGGVGPMTVAMLMDGLIKGAISQFENSSSIHIVPTPIKCLSPVPPDGEIAYSVHPKLISDLSKEILIHQNDLELYGRYKAKISLSVLDRLKDRKNGHYVVVAGITPTPLGEGKSTITIGLSQALGAQLGKPTIAVVRQPSQGPTFGIKGGAAGGGYSQVIPMEEFNLHLTGDIHAITAATNLLAAAIDARIFHETTQSDAALFKRLCPTVRGVRKFSDIMFSRLKRLGINKTSPNDLTDEEISKFVRLDIDPSSVTWNRVLDINDRFLRKITIGQSPTEKNMTRTTLFDISVASEIMAVLALSTSLEDMKSRLGKMVFGYSKSGVPLCADDLGITGALTVLMKDAIRPTMMQTLEGTPVFVHAGPFANIAHGCSSIIADRIALKIVGSNSEDPNDSGFVLTEAGFGSDIGLEKFMNVKSRYSKLLPDCVVLVSTVRALKMHGGGPPVTPGAKLSDEYVQENLELVRKGLPNLIRHIENCRNYGLSVVVTVNSFDTDSQAEIDLIINEAKKAGAYESVVNYCYARGGEGGVDLANAVIKACHHTAELKKNNPNQVQLTYNDDGTSKVYPQSDPENAIKHKIEAVAKSIYRAKSVVYSDLANQKLESYVKMGYSHLPICIAKTQYSFSSDPSLKNAPVDFELPIKDVRLSAGAGFIYPMCGDIQTMPGLPTRPCFYDIDIDTETGKIHGLS
ncbi:hypothetical protein BB560_006703 [Smittium megazygosporum]|uniref:Uncharacterized protein n=1 Tax=Smittium megazygosporum TaxID=133381 RepID=A0A2T9Y276_9FUNG|nr:hypothetical protein BB560_006703 [Smittium megazygosporum]